MNVHHLELFYYVALHGGIMPAVRSIPYGIQQPAVSAQVAQLEDALGVTLFQRRPFALTAEGERLFKFIQPFFGNLERVVNDLQGGQVRYFRIGGSAIILRDHLPTLLPTVRKKFPGLKIAVREGFQAQLVDMLSNDEVDLVVTTIDRQPPASLNSVVLLELPMVLLVEKSSTLKSADELWRRDKIDEPLVALPPHEAITRTFQTKLEELGLEWFTAVEASSVDFIEAYVAGGLGIGVSVRIPGKALSQDVRALPLKGFPPVLIGALWQGRQGAVRLSVVNAFVDLAKTRARQLTTR